MRQKHLFVLCMFVLLSSITFLPVAAQDGFTVSVGSNSDLGSFLVSSDGMTLYTFANDEPGVSNCVGQCLELWPAYTVESDEITSSVDLGGELGTISRDDGSLQVTFNNQPLYLYSEDQAPGDTNGQGVGNVWFVVPVSTPVVLSAESTELGPILTGPNKFTLYTFDADQPGVSNCIDQCRENWPPLTISQGESLTAGQNVPGILGGIPQDDGTVHVTYYGRPLYFFSGDENVGDTNGHGVGDVWFAADMFTLKLQQNNEIGSIIAANNGFSLYTFANDEPNVSNCVGQCLDLWPPYLVNSDVLLLGTAGIDGEIGTIEHEDGSLQVTLNNQPLYYYSGDEAPGATNGEGVGDVWFTIKRDDVRVVTNDELGTILAGANGMTLYAFANDEPNWSNCAGDCATAWPPLTLDEEGAVVAPLAIQADLATTLRADGTFQVTYQGQPLYFFSGDETPGETNGNGSGDVWSVVSVSLASCTVAPTDGSANARLGPGTEFEVAKELVANHWLIANGQTVGFDDFVWWRLETGEWVRSDVVEETGDCDALPQIERPALPGGDSNTTDTTGTTDSGPTATEEP